jgi:hypothetical protein
MMSGLPDAAGRIADRIQTGSDPWTRRSAAKVNCREKTFGLKGAFGGNEFSSNGVTERETIPAGGLSRAEGRAAGGNESSYELAV